MTGLSLAKLPQFVANVDDINRSAMAITTAMMNDDDDKYNGND